MEPEKPSWTKAKWAWMPIFLSILLLMSLSLFPDSWDTLFYVFLVIYVISFFLSVISSIVFTVLCFCYHKRFRNTVIHGLIGLFAIFIAVMCMVTYYKRGRSGRLRVVDYPPEGLSNIDIPIEKIPENL